MQSAVTLMLLATLAAVVLSAKMMKPGEQEMEMIGPCVNMRCPDSYSCNSQQQCVRPRPQIRPNSQPIGPCVNLLCPSNHICQISENKCYPQA